MAAVGTGRLRCWRVPEWIRHLPDIVFPPVCVACGGVVEGGGYRHVCAACAGRIEFLGGLGGWPTPAAVRLGGPTRDLVHAFKYRGARYVARDMERIVGRAPWLLDHVRGAVLVPVPLHPRRERERGFNQSLLFARSLARAAGGGTRLAPVLRRTIDTPPQAGRDAESRRANLKNAFALALRPALNPCLRFIIVDDVFTTGSTVQSCARALRESGCRNVDSAAFAVA